MDNLMIGRMAGITGPVSITLRTIFGSQPGIGAAVAWTPGTYFDSCTSQSGVTTNDLTNTDNMCWQLFYTWKDLTINEAANTTAQASGESYVTAINKVWHGGWPSGPTSGIPTQLGGTTTGYTQYDVYVPVLSVKLS